MADFIGIGNIRYTAAVVEIYHNSRRVASHARIEKPGAFVTETIHMPHAHRRYLDWTPERIKLWGEKIGPCARELMEGIMEHREHPEHGFRNCLGIIRLAKTYPPERVETACKRALELKAYNYRSVKSLLECNLENVDPAEKTVVIPLHANIRGNGYYGEVTRD